MNVKLNMVWGRCVSLFVDILVELTIILILRRNALSRVRWLWYGRAIFSETAPIYNEQMQWNWSALWRGHENYGLLVLGLKINSLWIWLFGWNLLGCPIHSWTCLLWEYMTKTRSWVTWKSPTHLHFSRLAPLYTLPRLL